MFIRYRPRFYILILLSHLYIQVLIHLVHYRLRIPRISNLKKLYVFSFYLSSTLFLGSFLIFCFLQKTIDTNMYFIISFLSFLFSKCRSPINIKMRNNQIVQLIIIVIILQQLFMIFKMIYFDFIFKLFSQQLYQILMSL